MGGRMSFVGPVVPAAGASGVNKKEKKMEGGGGLRALCIGLTYRLS